MNRIDFMTQLESLLQGISEQERNDALLYYYDYFNDAGEENEQDVIDALGNPARVAENIKKDLYGNMYSDGFEQKSTPTGREVIKYGAKEISDDSENTSFTPNMVRFIIGICIIAALVLVPGIGSTVISIITLPFAIVLGWFTTILAFGIIAIVLVISAIILMIVGICCLAFSPMAALGVIGAALLCGGLGIFFIILVVTMAGIATPAIIKGCIHFYHKFLEKRIFHN